MEFVDDDGKVRVRARSWWAIIDKAAGRPIRVPAEVIAPFLTLE
jgi:acyl-CoA thioester hydrolase